MEEHIIDKIRITLQISNDEVGFLRGDDINRDDALYVQRQQIILIPGEKALRSVYSSSYRKFTGSRNVCD